MASIKKVEWHFPGKDFLFLKIESFAVAITSILVFLVTLAQSTPMISLIVTISFLVVYTVTSFIIATIRKAEEHYHLNSTHLNITRKTRFRSKKEKISLKRIKHHNLDRFFLGGYVLTETDKHLVFFNNLKELEQFEKKLKKHLKKK